MTAIDDAAHEAAELKGARCVSCMVYVFYVPRDEPEVSGHIATQAGLNEFHISHLCEKCFDDATVEVPEPIKVDIAENGAFGPLTTEFFKKWSAQVDHGGWEDH